ncbi:MAG: helix-turn-helix domain-containing protein [Chloroflexi bacterium]|nr:helix-turn-helix domain-containing protein [Chloroflexota bacterium]
MTTMSGQPMIMLDEQLLWNAVLSQDSRLDCEVNLSPYHLQRTFKQVMGVTPKQYAVSLRLERLKAQLKGGSSVTTALYDAGYSSSSRMYEQASERLDSEHRHNFPRIETLSIPIPQFR